LRVFCTAPHVARSRADVLVVSGTEASIAEMLAAAQVLVSRDWHTQTEHGLAAALVAALEELRERRAAD
jgi:energy-converting hydrogenase Eha subunit G